MLVKLIFGSALLVAASCHMCLLSPVQRSTMQTLNKPASADCIRVKSPCGGVPAKDSITLALRHSSNLTVVFQKNLDHWTQATPGYFSVSFGMGDKPASFKEAARIPDGGEPSLHVYTADVMLPAMAKQMKYTAMSLQVVYITNNTMAPPAFYQCADFILY